MQTSFTHEFMQNNCGCYSQSDLMACSFMKPKTVLLEDILSSEISLKDKYWFVCRKLASKEQNQQIAIAVAEIVLPLFEKKYPEDKRPREAIEAAKLFIAGGCTLYQLIDKRKAAAAAADAYAAAYAAAAYAAYAAYAAAYATDAAAYATDAAAYATDAYAAYADAAIKDQLLNYLKEFCSKATMVVS